jgi:hypothetical protein
MTEEYSYNNIEAMLNSISSNAELIDSIMKTIRTNDVTINTRLSTLAASREALQPHQIELYRSYLSEKETIDKELALSKEAMTAEDCRHYITAEIYNGEPDYSAIHKIFEKVNDLQIKLMGMLCNLLGMSNAILGTL